MAKKNIIDESGGTIGRVDLNTGEIHENKLNQIITITTRRPNGTLRVQYDYSNCISRTDPTGAEMTDLNYLVNKYTPNELANYLAMKNMGKQPIMGHDFSKEPNLQDSMNEVVRLQNEFKKLSPEVHAHFKNVHEFLKFTDNPKNVEQMLKLGLATKKEIEKLNPEAITTPTPQKETEKKAPDVS